jgi:hypothetical protein
VTGYLRAAVACRLLAVLAVAGTVWLGVLDRPLLAVLAGWVAFLGVFFGGRFHAAHHRTPASPVTRNRSTTVKETTTT